jgi:hypothetical protein
MGTIDGFLLCVCGVLGGAFDDSFGDTSDDSMSEAGAGAVGGVACDSTSETASVTTCE